MISFQNRCFFYFKQWGNWCIGLEGKEGQIFAGVCKSEGGEVTAVIGFLGSTEASLCKNMIKSKVTKIQPKGFDILVFRARVKHREEFDLNV